MRNNLHVFLGATVADAAARPLHWVYNQKKLFSYIKGKKDFAFLKKNKSPFYNIKTGKVSGYNDVGQVMFKTLIEGHENIEERFKKNITKNFGPGSVYWRNLNLLRREEVLYEFTMFAILSGVRGISCLGLNMTLSASGSILYNLF